MPVTRRVVRVDDSNPSKQPAHKPKQSHAHMQKRTKASLSTSAHRAKFRRESRARLLSFAPSDGASDGAARRRQTTLPRSNPTRRQTHTSLIRRRGQSTLPRPHSTRRQAHTGLIRSLSRRRPPATQCSGEHADEYRRVAAGRRSRQPIAANAAIGSAGSPSTIVLSD